MKIVQLLPTVAYGDAVSNDALAMRGIIRSMGYPSEIYADILIGSNIKDYGILNFNDLLLSPNDILIYHLSIGSRLNYLIEKFHCKKIMVYHNITPSSYFLGYDPNTFSITKKGVAEAIHLNNKFDYCLADSEFNKQDLLNYGYKCNIDVLPVIVPFSDYDKKPSKKILRKYADHMTNILFVGRGAPNKKIENVIATFSQYYKNYNSQSRLFIVGHWNGMGKYKAQLDDYVCKLGMHNVVFTGHVGFEDLLSYYKLADVFVCMSEHEGFCVPLVEAMHFDIPIVARAHAAVPYTLGGSGILLNEYSPLLAAGAIDLLVNNSTLRKNIIAGQRERLRDFSYPVLKAKFESYLNNFIRGE